jgi:hypothetical protein
VSKAFISSNRRTLTMFVVILCLTFFLDLTAAAQKIEHESSNAPRVPTSGNTGASANSPWLSLNYTGALFGYYRVERGEKRGEEPLEPPRKFLDRRLDSSFLLGMGDNFGPEFGASVEKELLQDDTCKLPVDQRKKGLRQLPPEALYKADDRLPLMAECDNVARFLMLAGYRAIVPGKEDFMYSATWLRRIAVLFRGVSDLKKHGTDMLFPERGIHQDFVSAEMQPQIPRHTPLMLAANLRLNFTAEGIQDELLAKQLKSGGNSICPLFFDWEPLEPSAETCISGGNRGNTVTIEMDWLRRLDSTLRREQGCVPSGSDPELCFPVAKSMNLQAGNDPVFRKQLQKNQSQMVLATLHLFPKDEVILKCAIDLLDSEKQKAIDDSEKKSASQCSKSDGKPDSGLEKWINNNCPATDKYLCQVLDALRNNFQQPTDKDKVNRIEKEFLFPPEARQAAIRLLLKAIAREQWNVGYTISDQILVIGVVGQETMKAVPRNDLKICTKWTSEVSRYARTEDLARCDDPRPGASSLRRSLEGVPLEVQGRLSGVVEVGDPALSITTILRAAWLQKSDKPFDRVVVMAQMPRTEAEELAARILSSLKNTSGDGNSSESPRVDLILSEAQNGHISPALEVRYSGDSLIPVLTPKPAWDLQGDGLVDPVSTAAVSVAPCDVACGRILTNSIPNQIEPNPPTDTMAKALEKQLISQTQSADRENLGKFWDDCKTRVLCENSTLIQYLLKQLQRISSADVVLLEDRDFYFGPLLKGYGGYDICEAWMGDDGHSKFKAPGVADSRAYCQLHVALDRVLWKGDFSERVMVTGKTLTDMLTTAQQQSDDDETLQAKDTTQQWLTTYGVTTALPRNLSAASMGSAGFTIPGIELCEKEPDKKSPPYCINGKFVSDDSSYLIATSDDLAQDTQLYKALAGLDARYHIESERYITGDIADEVYVHDSKGGAQLSVSADDQKSGVRKVDAESGMRKIEEGQQKRPILQLDYAKVVAGFMLRKPDMSSSDLATNFSGVADSRATTPNAQEVDFEAQSRMTRGLGDQSFWQRLKLGIQTDLEYDRAVTGNITGSPETVTYALNNFTSGGFLQMRLFGDRASSRWLLVIAPYQYQQQITGNYLNFKFATPPGQLTVSTPRWNGFVQRIGIRHEFGGPFTGSYIETGPEFSDIHNILSGLILPDGVTECKASETSFSSCFSADGLIIKSSTVLTPVTQDVRSGGWYWDVHIERALDKTKHSSLTLETKGDVYAWPSATLPTQTQHAFTTTAAINFAVIGNLAFSPTYTTFFYRNQGPSGHSLVTNSISVTAKWYFWRDAAVPFWRQMWFSGPASLDQTKSAKMK